MVKLTTTYDTSIHKKVFVLKGGEAYVNSTDVIASLVTLNDSETHMSNARYGLAIKVLRSIGNSSLVVYNNDKIVSLNDGTMLEHIYWGQDMASHTFPYGIYYDTDVESDYYGYLIIGLDYDESEIETFDTGIFLDYDVEHNIVVKYLGNEYCLKSYSDIITKTIPYPTVFNTSITLETSHSNRVYAHNETPSITATLLDGNDSPVQSADLVIYVDGELVSGTHQTNSSGQYTYTPSVSNGLHSVEIKYLGEANTLLASENSIDFSYGYDISMEYEEVWFNGLGSIDVTVKDYYSNPIDDVEVTCAIGYYTINGYTDANGETTLANTHPDIVVTDPLTVSSEYGDVSDEFEIRPAYVTSCSITGTNLETWANGSTLPLTVSVTATDYTGYEDVSLEGCEVELTNATSSKVVINSNNNATCYYAPSGVGEVEVTASIGGEEGSVVVSDYSFVHKNGTTYVGSVSVKSCNMNSVHNGLKFTSTSSSRGLVNFNPVQNIFQSDKWEIKFDVTDMSEDPIAVYGITAEIGVPDTVKYRSINGMNYLYVNDVLISSQSQGGLAGIVFNMYQTGQTLTIK